MTSEDLIKEITALEKEGGNGWDSKVYSAIARYSLLRNYKHELVTQALIAQVKHWIAAEQTLERVKEALK